MDEIEDGEKKGGMMSSEKGKQILAEGRRRETRRGDVRRKSR